MIITEKLERIKDIVGLDFPTDLDKEFQATPMSMRLIINRMAGYIEDCQANARQYQKYLQKQFGV